MIKEKMKYQELDKKDFDGFYSCKMYKMIFTQQVNLLMIQSNMYFFSFCGHKQKPDSSKITLEDPNNDAERTF